jgi:Big-like domain-containing protein
MSRRALSVIASIVCFVGVIRCGSSEPSATVESVTVTGTATSVAPGQTLQLSATARFTNGSTDEVTTTASWSSLNPAAATVSSSGLVTAVAAGSAEIRATFQGRTGGFVVQVGPPTLSSLTLGGTPSFREGQTAQWSASAMFSNGSTQDVTSSAQWSSLNTGVASVSPAGIVTGNAVGSADIRAQYQGLTQTRAVQILKAVEAALTVTPDPATVSEGVLPGQCGVYPNGGFNRLRCTFDASSSVPAGSITNFKWDIPFDTATGGVHLEGANRITVSNQVIDCGFGLSGTGTGAGAAVVKKVRLTVVGPGGREDTITPDVTFIRAGGC